MKMMRNDRRYDSKCHTYFSAIQGFTLVELLVVLTIIGVLAGGMTAMLMSHRDSSNTQIAAKDLGAAFAFAAAQARMRTANFQISLNEDGRQFRVELLPEVAPGENIPAEAIVPAEGEPGRWHRFPEGVQVVAVLVGDRPVKPLPSSFFFSGNRLGFVGTVELSGGNESWTVEVLDGCTVSIRATKSDSTQPASGVYAN